MKKNKKTGINIPFTLDEFSKILMILDVALGDERLEGEISNWLKTIYNISLSEQEFEDLHKKVNFYIQEDLEIGCKEKL